MTPRVSVVMIFLDEERFLAEAIESVRAQTFTDWELLLVDDGSSDGSSAIARGYAEREGDRIRYLEHPGHENRGMSASRNLGIRHARGDLVALLDADDVWLQHKLSRQVALLDANPDAEMIYGATEYWHGWTGRPEDVARDHRPDLGIPVGVVHEPPTLALRLYPLGRHTAPTPSGLMIRRTTVEQVGGFEEAFTGFYEDQAFLIKVYLHARVLAADETWERYRIHDASCSAATDRAGAYRLVRLRFLEWLEGYLRTGRHDLPGVWAALQAARRDERLASGTGATPGWNLRLGGQRTARLVPDAGGAGEQRIEIDPGFEAGALHEVQVNWPRLELRAGYRYRVTLRIRADTSRQVAVGIAEAHEPWQGLGWYDLLEIGPTWREVIREFTATADEHNARIHVDMGQHPAAVELAPPLFEELGGESPPDRPMTRQRLGVDLGDLRRLEPISRKWGLDRGQPIDRHYLEEFLARHAGDIRGRVLEIEDDGYTRRFGGDRVRHRDVLHVTAGNPRATLIGDLSAGAELPSGVFDCIILTQTLHLIYDTRAALATLHRMLAPGGVLLATFPGLSRRSGTEWADTWYWGFTSSSASRLFTEAFGTDNVHVEAHGNVLTTIAFLHGLATTDLSEAELVYRDPEFELLVTVRARRTELAP